jgi:hypothetical protein
MRTVAILILVPALWAQSPEERGWTVLEAALKAAGGREKLSAVRDMSFDLQSRMATPIGEVTFTSHSRLVFPDTVRQDLNMPSGSMTIAFNSTQGWRKGPPGVEKIPADQLRRTLAHLQKVNVLFRPPSDRKAVRWVTNEAVEGHGCDVIEVRLGDGEPARLYVERNSGELLKRSYRVENSSGGMALVEEFLTDYREVAGLRLSFQVRELRDGKFARESTTSNMKINSGLQAEDLVKEFR